MKSRVQASRRPQTQELGNVAEAYLARLGERGIEYLFGNAGTDFAPLIEAYAHAAQTGVRVPRPGDGTVPSGGRHGCSLAYCWYTGEIPKIRADGAHEQAERKANILVKEHERPGEQQKDPNKKNSRKKQSSQVPED